MTARIPENVSTWLVDCSIVAPFHRGDQGAHDGCHDDSRGRAWPRGA